MARLDLLAYLDAVCGAVDLPIPAEYRTAVADNLQRLLVLAAPLMDFPLDEADEIAPKFQP